MYSVKLVVEITEKCKMTINNIMIYFKKVTRLINISKIKVKENIKS